MKHITVQLLLNLLILSIIISSCKNNKQNELITDQFLAEKIYAIDSINSRPQIPDNLINLMEFSGKKPDLSGTYDFASDISSAIDSLTALGGGTLYFAHTADLKAWVKTFTTYRIKGPIELASNIRILIDPSVQLWFEFDPVSYLPGGKGVITRHEGTTLYSFSPLIRGFNVQNIIIEKKSGSGGTPKLFGDGIKWQNWSTAGEDSLEAAGQLASKRYARKINNLDMPLRERRFDKIGEHFLRPPTIQFFLSKNILVQDVHISESPFWCIHPVFSENLRFKEIFFDSHVINNDGIDPESSSNVMIENIIFNNRDDNVAIKAGRDLEGRKGVDISGTILENISSTYIKVNKLGGVTENVVVRNSVFKGHNAICIGSEMSGGVRNVYVVDNVAPQGVGIGFFLKGSRKRGGFAHHIYVKNNRFSKVASLVDIIPNYDGDAESEFPPEFHHIYIENMYTDLAERGIRVFGWYDQPIHDVYLKNVKVKHVTEKKSENIQVSQAKDVYLSEVEVNNTIYNQTFNTLEKGKVPPKQK